MAVRLAACGFPTYENLAVRKILNLSARLLTIGAVSLALLGSPLAAQDRGLIIRQLKFAGNHSIDATLLAAAISTTSSSYFATSGLIRWLGLGEKRRLNERELRRDVVRLRLFYQSSGFLDVKVDTLVNRTDEDVFIVFNIAEGRPVLVRELAVAGLDSIDHRDRLLQDLPLTVGMPFNRALLLTSADTLQTRLRDRGYPTASVFLNRRDIDREQHTADLGLLVDPGQLASIGSITVSGTSKVDSSVVRSLLATRVGQQYRQTDLYTSQLNLYRSDLFRFATVRVDTTAFAVGDRAVPLVVEVEEGRFHRVRASAGYATNDCFRTSAGWTRRNFLGGGQAFDVTGQLSKIGVGRPLDFGAANSALCRSLLRDSVGSEKVNYGVSASLRRPAFLSSSNAITLSIFAERRSEFQVYLREDVGTSLTFTRETERRVPIVLSYRVSYGRTLANAVSFCAFFNACRSADVEQLRQRRPLATLTASISSQRVNNPLDPTRGSLYTLEATHSSRITGSSEFSRFTRGVAEAAMYRPLGGDLVLAARIRGGLIIAPRLQLAGGATNFIPPDQRFYAGGANDVRGYNRNELGPVVYTVLDSAANGGNPASKDVKVAPTGGNTLVLGNLELRFPAPVLRSRLRLAAFVDAGGVWERGASQGSSAAIRVTPGVGIRFATPLGPTRFDLGYNPYQLPTGALYSQKPNGDLDLVRLDYRKDITQRFTLQFSVGQAF